MCIDSKTKFRSIRCILVVLFALSNIKFVRSVIVSYGETINNTTCEAITYHEDRMYQCEFTLHANQFLSERLLLNFNKLQLKCSDTIYIYDSPNVSGDPTFTLTCENKTGIVIYSTNDSILFELVTADPSRLHSEDFYLVYTSFTDSKNGCDGFVCKDGNKYCIPQEFRCNGYYHCEDGSDEGIEDCMEYDDGDDRIKLITPVCVASFILLLGIVWLCAHTRKIMRNRAVIQRNGVTNNN